MFFSYVKATLEKQIPVIEVFAMSCPVCYKAKADYYASKNSYDFYRCQSCSLIFVSPMPPQEVLQALYQDYHKTTQYTAKLQSKIRRASKRIRSIKRHTKGKRFIDVGCNAGFAVEAARRLGFDALGIDVDEKVIEIARKSFPQTEYQCISVQRLAESGEKFDLIYCSEVIEHLSIVNDFVEALAEILNEGGVMYMTTPDIAHYSVAKKAESLMLWDAIRPPEHLCHFSKESLSYVLKKGGFSKVKFKFSFKPTINAIAKK